MHCTSAILITGVTTTPHSISNMEVCTAVEKEQHKVYSKLLAASESTSKKLKDSIDELMLLKGRLSEGQSISNAHNQ